MFRVYLYSSTLFLLAIGFFYGQSPESEVTLSGYLEQAAQVETISQSWEEQLLAFERRHLGKEISDEAQTQSELERLHELRQRVDLALKALPTNPEAEEHRKMMGRRYLAGVAYAEEIERLLDQQTAGQPLDLSGLEAKLQTLEDARSQLFLWRGHHQP